MSRKLQSEKNSNKMQTMTLFIFTMTARIYVFVQAWHEILAHYLHPLQPPRANSSNPSPLIPASRGVVSICQEHQHSSPGSAGASIFIPFLCKSSHSLLPWMLLPLRVLWYINHCDVLFLVVRDGCGLDAAVRPQRRGEDPADISLLVPRATQKEK